MIFAGGIEIDPSDLPRAARQSREARRYDLSSLRLICRTEERVRKRRTTHLVCEQRRRSDIQEGINQLRELIEKDTSTQSLPSRKSALSRVEVVTAAVKKVETLRKSVSNLQLEYLQLQADNDRLKRLRNLPLPHNQ